MIFCYSSLNGPKEGQTELTCGRYTTPVDEVGVLRVDRWEAFHRQVTPVGDNSGISEHIHRGWKVSVSSASQISGGCLRGLLLYPVHLLATVNLNRALLLSDWTPL